MNNLSVMMIDLTGAKVGEQYVIGSGEVMTVLIKTVDAIVLGNDELSCMVDFGGETQHANSSMSVIRKHEPRHWLKDLPSADLFELYGGVDLTCGENGVWLSHDEGGFTLPLNKGKMPTLTGDEWKDSKISIVDLKAWQEQNND